MRLFDYKLAYNPAKARLALAEKGLQYETVEVNLFNGQSLEPWFMKINPASTLPVLEDGELRLTESLDIVKHVDTLGDGPLGGDSIDRTWLDTWYQQVDAWDGNLFMAANSSPIAKKVLGGLSYFRVRTAEARAAEHPELRSVYEAKLGAMRSAAAREGDGRAIADNEARLVGILDTAEQLLGSSEWLGGSKYCMGDALLTVVLFRIGMAGVEQRYLPPRPAVSSFQNRVKSRPSYGMALAPALSGGTAARLLLPALARASWARLTGRY